MAIQLQYPIRFCPVIFEFVVGREFWVLCQRLSTHTGECFKLDFKKKQQKTLSMVAQALNPSGQEAVADRSLSSRPVRSTTQIQKHQGLHTEILPQKNQREGDKSKINLSNTGG